MVEITKALIKAQSEMHAAVRAATNPHFKSKFADLSEVLAVCKPALNSNDIFLSQITMVVDGSLILKTSLMHVSGQCLESHYPIKPLKEDPQGYGSALSYAKRYSLVSLLSIETTDDDAEQAMGRQPQHHALSQNPVVQNHAPLASKTTITKSTPQQSFLPAVADIVNPAPSKWVQAVQAKSQPNHDPIGDFTPTFGKYKGMKIRDVLVHDLNNYCEYLQKSEATSERPLGANAVTFIEKVREFLQTREPAPKPQDSSIMDDIERDFLSKNVPF